MSAKKRRKRLKIPKLRVPLPRQTEKVVPDLRKESGKKACRKKVKEEE